MGEWPSKPAAPTIEPQESDPPAPAVRTAEAMAPPLVASDICEWQEAFMLLEDFHNLHGEGKACRDNSCGDRAHCVSCRAEKDRSYLEDFALNAETWMDTLDRAYRNPRGDGSWWRAKCDTDPVGFLKQFAAVIGEDRHFRKALSRQGAVPVSPKTLMRQAKAGGLEQVFCRMTQGRVTKSEATQVCVSAYWDIGNDTMDQWYKKHVDPKSELGKEKTRT